MKNITRYEWEFINLYLMLIYKKIQKKAKNIENKCYSSTTSVQNGLKTHVRSAFFTKKKLLVILTYLRKNRQ